MRRWAGSSSPRHVPAERRRDGRLLPERHGPGRVLVVAILVAVAILVPVLNLYVEPTSAIHVPGYAIPLMGKYLSYALLALSVGLIWGYCGILSLGHGAFFALGGYAMGMYLMRQIGSARRLRQSRPAGLHGLPQLDRTAGGLVRLRALPVRDAHGAARAGRARLRLRLVRLPEPGHRRLSLDHHPGDDLRPDARLLPQQFRLRRQQRPDRLQGYPRLQHPGAGDPRRALRRYGDRARASPSSSARRSSPRASARCWSRSATPRAGRGSSATGSRTTSSWCGRCRPAWPASPARSTCPQVGIINPGEFAPGEFDRGGDLGGGRRTRHCWSGRSSARSSSTSPRPGSPPARSPPTGSSPSAGCSSLVTLFLPKGIVGTIADGWSALSQRRSSAAAEAGISPSTIDGPPGGELKPSAAE